MSNRDRQDGQQAEHMEDELLGPLFSYASSRQKAPPEHELAIRDASAQVWRSISRQRRRQRHIYAFAVAASLILAITVIIQMRGIPNASTTLQQIASVEKQTGEIYVRNTGDEDAVAIRLKGQDIFAGQTVKTPDDSRLALNWLSGESLRVDEHSELVLVSAVEIRLMTGRIYIDTHGAKGSQATFVIETAAGKIEHLGTQYMVGISGQQMAVTVREGEVRVHTGATQSTAHNGEKLSIDHSGLVEVSRAPGFGGDWEWAALVAPAFKLDGASAFEFIHWVGRETGRSILFDRESTARLARETQLHGSISLEPARALQLILQTSDLQAVIAGENILVKERQET